MGLFILKLLCFLLFSFINLFIYSLYIPITAVPPHRSPYTAPSLAPLGGEGEGPPWVPTHTGISSHLAYPLLLRPDKMAQL